MPVNPVLEKASLRSQVHAITITEYHRMVKAGIVQEDVELIQGVLIRKMSKSPLHSEIVSQVEDTLRPLLPAELRIRTEQPITALASEPEPDVAVVKGNVGDFVESHPGTALFVVEVALTSLDADRVKADVYAEINVNEYWIINLNNMTIEAYLRPHKGRYAEKSIYEAGEQIPVQCLGGKSFSVAELLLIKG